MTDHERLLDNYEDALFALMMDEFAEQEGQRLLEENERLKQDPSATIPPDVDRRCLKTIKQTFIKKQRQELLRVVYQMFKKVAVFAFVAMILYALAYAAFPKVRTKTLNLLIKMSDVSVELTLDENSCLENPNNGDMDSDRILHGYRLPQIPDGFEIHTKGSTPMSGWVRYTDKHERFIYISIAAAGDMVRNRDSEDVTSIENIQIHGYDGLIIEKDNRIDITWGDTDKGNFISVVCTGLNRDSALQFAEGLEFIE